MPAITTTYTSWGVRTVLTAFIVACHLYNKHRARCEHFLPAEVCGVLAAVCDIVTSLGFAYDNLPPVGTRG